MIKRLWISIIWPWALPLTIVSTVVGLFCVPSISWGQEACRQVLLEASPAIASVDLAEQIRQGDLFASKAFYDSYGDPEVAQKIIKKWYREYSLPLIQSFTAHLPSRFLVLLIDPGIATRAAEFLPFAEKSLEQDPTLSAQKLRDLFAHSLGTEKVFRGLLLNPGEAENIQKYGMEARALSSPSANFRLQSEFNGDNVSYGVPNLIRQGFVGEVQSRLNGRFLSESMLLSVSKWIEVTSATAWNSKGNALSPEKKFYLFEIEIPKISLLRLEGPFRQLNNSVGSWKYYETKAAFSDENFRRSVLDPDFEMFIFGKIPSSSIKQVHQYEQRPAPWHPAN